MRSSRKPRRRRKEKQNAAGWLELAGEWAEHLSAVQRQENHVPHYRATKAKFCAASFLGCLETQVCAVLVRPRVSSSAPVNFNHRNPTQPRPVTDTVFHHVCDIAL